MQIYRGARMDNSYSLQKETQLDGDHLVINNSFNNEQLTAITAFIAINTLNKEQFIEASDTHQYRINHVFFSLATFLWYELPHLTKSNEKNFFLLIQNHHFEVLETMYEYNIDLCDPDIVESGIYLVYLVLNIKLKDIKMVAPYYIRKKLEKIIHVIFNQNKQPLI